MANRQRAQQIAEKTLRRVYAHVPEDRLSAVGPLEEYLKIRGERLPYTFRVSRTHGGASVPIADAVAQGADREDLGKLGFSPHQIQQAKKTLLKYGFSVNPEATGPEAFFKKLSGHPPDDEVRRLFSATALESIINYHRRKKLSLVFTLTDLLKSLDRAILTRQIPKMAEVIRSRGIPIFPWTKWLKNGEKVGTTWIVTSWHRSQIEELILNDPKIKVLAPDMPVTQLTGPKKGRFTTFQVLALDRKKFQSLSSIFQELGFPSNTWIHTFPIGLLEKAIEPIFRVRKSGRRGERFSYYVPIEHSAALRSYIEKNLLEKTPSI